MRNDERTWHRAWVADVVRALLEKRRREVLAMLASCDVNPRDIPLWPEIWREEDGVHIDRYMRNEHGSIRKDDIGPMVEEAVISPAFVPDWIAYD